MSVQIRDDLPGIDAASAELDRLMADESQAGTGQSQEGASNKAEGSSANEGQSAAQTQDKGTQETQDQSTETKAGTPATADKDKAKQDAEKGKTAAQDKAQSQSRYAKERERSNKSWSELNAQKEAFSKERQEFDRQKAEFQQMLDETEEGFTPEQYDEAARKFEEAGKLDLAEAAKNKAEQLRKNPDPKVATRKARLEERRKQTEAQSKEWTLKAGVDFPDVAKDKSPLQMRVADLLREEPDLKTHPKGIYMAARLATAEAAAASVPDKDKELAQLRAKVSELEKLTSPGGEGGPTNLPADKSFEQMSGDEQLGALERQAQEIGAIR